jgi:diacylglycerol kinase (ATP)
MHDFGHLQLIVNRSALAKQGKASFGELRRALEERGVPFDAVEVRGHAEAGDAARTAYGEGVRYLVAVGGDGTLHAVLNGVGDADSGVPEDLVLGVASADHGGDFARTVGLRLPPKPLATRLATANTMRVDVGVVEFTDGASSRRRLFINSARVGYGAELARLEERLPRALGRFRHLLAAWWAIRRTERRPARVELAHGGRKVEVVEIAVANGQFAGGGMRLAPRAMPDDGRFNVLAFMGEPKQVFVLTVDMFQGRHLPNPQISEWQSPFVGVEADTPLRVEADGEPLGTTPARFSLLERALRLKI